MDTFIELSLILIEKHGKYNLIFNNCTNFVEAFLFKTMDYENWMVYQAKQNKLNQNLIKDKSYQKYKEMCSIYGSITSFS